MPPLFNFSGAQRVGVDAGRNRRYMRIAPGWQLDLIAPLFGRALWGYRSCMYSLDMIVGSFVFAVFEGSTRIEEVQLI